MRTRRFFATLCLAMAFVSLAMFPSFGVQASAADEITVGVIGPMKFVYGEDMKRCSEMAAEKINAAGGVKVQSKSYKIVLRYVDDNDLLSVPDAVSAMERLATVDKVKYVIGGMRTEAVLAQQEIMADNKMIFLGTGSAHDEQCLRVGRDYNRYKYWFRVLPVATKDQGTQYIAMLMPVIKALNNMGIKKPKVAIMADKAQWAEPVVEVAQKLFPLLGCEVVGVWRPGFNATSFTSELSAIKTAGAHMIYNLVAGAPGNVISLQWGELQIPAALTGVNNEAGKISHWKTTNGKCNYMQTTLGLADAPMTPKTQPFIAEFKKRYATDETPVYTGYGAHDSLYILKDAMERAGSLDPDAIVPALEKTNYVGLTGIMAFSPAGSKQPHDLIWGPNKYTPYSMQWRDGKQYIIWPDGREVPEALIAAGAPRGWDKMKSKDIVDYVLPPWVVEYWKGKK
jgi:branched-chain amino acid transport system substrate-binding protein